MFLGLLLLSIASSALAIDCPSDTTTPTFYADPSDCSIYYECIRGNVYQFTCPTGLLWNDEMKYCDEKDYVQCNVTPTTTAPPNDVCSTTETHNVVYPEDCSMYYKCVNGQSTVKKCPENMYFNPTTSACDYMDLVDCSASTPTTRSTQSTTTTITTPSTPSTTSLPDTVCDSTETHNAVYPLDCSKYYRCVNGKGTLRDCPENMLFNPKTSTCDYMDEVDCTVTTPSVPSTTTTPTTKPVTTPVTSSTAATTTTTTTTTTKRPDSVCEGQPDGTYVADPTSCKSFYECINNQGSKFTCPGGTIWEQSILSCVSSDKDC